MPQAYVPSSTTTEGAAVFNAGGAILAKLLKKDKPLFAFSDDRRSTLAEHGRFLPLLLGRRRIAPLVAWTGFNPNHPFPNQNLAEFIENIFGHGSVHNMSKAFVQTYSSAAVHMLCIGPVYAIHAVYKDGRPAERFGPQGSPVGRFNVNLAGVGTNHIQSGTQVGNPLDLFDIDLFPDIWGLASWILQVNPIVGAIGSIIANLLQQRMDIGTERLGIWTYYWGHPGGEEVGGLGDAQPVNDFWSLQSELPSRIDPLNFARMPESRWPWICYAHWWTFLLGDDTTWPELQYLVERRPTFTGLSGSDPWMEATANAQGINDSGVNYAHALYEILHAPFPRGLGIPLDDVDQDALERLGVLCASERLCGHILADDGTTAAAMIGQALSEIGVQPNDLNGKLYFTPIRALTQVEIDALPEADDATIQVGDDQVQIDHGRRYVTHATFTWEDEQSYDRKAGVVVGDDSLTLDGQGIRALELELKTVGDALTGRRLAERKAVELIAKPRRFKPQIGRWGRSLNPGDPFKIESVGLVRVNEVTMNASSAEAEVDCQMDLFGVEQVSYFPEDALENTSPIPRPYIATPPPAPIFVGLGYQLVHHGGLILTTPMELLGSLILIF